MMSEYLPDELSRCLSLFRNAADDNERLASLLLVTKISKSNEMSIHVRRKIYDSVGFDFINRLLATGTKDAGDEMLHHVAIAILACYCTDPDLMLHPQITSKIGCLNELISSSNYATVLIQDSLHCLLCIVQHQKGVEYLWKHHSLSSLFDCYTKHKDSQGFVKKIVSQFLSDKCLILHYDEFASSVTGLTVQFKELHEELKFDICDLLTTIVGLSILETSNKLFHQWLINIGIGLKDILLSKIDSHMRQKAMLLSGALCQQFGAEWTLPIQEKYSSLLLLLVNYASIEVQVLLKGYYTEPQLMVISCFSILESVIVVMANQENDNLKSEAKMDEETLLQLHTTLFECLSFIVQSLKGHKEKEASRKHSEIQLQLHYMIAAIRLLGAWLAEDSLSLSDDVYSLLPYLLGLCDCVENDILKFLLPGFNHFAADCKPRNILVSNGLLDILLKHVQCYNKRFPCYEETQSQILSCCSVLLTLLLSDQLVLQNDAASIEWLIVLASIIIQQSDSSNFFKIHSSLLFLILVERNSKSIAICDHVFTIKHIVEILSSSLSLLQCNQCAWNSISELWHISMQELKILVTNSSDIKRLFNQQNYFQSFIIEESVSEEYKDIVSSIRSVVNQAILNNTQK